MGWHWTRRIVIGVVAAAPLAGIGALPSHATPPAAEWPMYGADLSNSRSVAGGPSPLSVLRLTTAWRADFSDGDFTGTPVVSGGIVYVGSDKGAVHAIRVTGGSAAWTARVGGGVNASLAVSNGRVFVPVAIQGAPAITALDEASGAPVWSTVLDTSPDADVYGSPMPVTYHGRDMVLEGVSAVSGDPASPLRGSVVALDAITGSVIWKSYTVPPGFNGGAVWSTPAVDVAAGVVYAGTGNAYSGAAAGTTDAIVKLDLGTGAILGALQGTSRDVFSSSTPGLDFDFGASPNLFSIGGRPVVGDGAKSGIYWVADRASMRSVWHTQVGAGSLVGGILGSTAFDASTGRVIGPVSLPGYLWSLNATNGLPNWITTGLLDVVHLSPVAVSNGVVYSVSTAGFLEAFLEATGTPLAERPLNPIPPTKGYTLALASGVAVADGLVIADIGSQGVNGSVVAFGAP